MRPIRGWLFRVAGYLSRVGGGSWFGWLFERTYGWLPLEHLGRTDRLLVIEHPRPSYPFHALIIPRRAARSLQDVQPDLLLEILQTAASTASNFGLQDYRIVVNGGAYQDLPQLHFHLISEKGAQTAG
jgi:diadenosine tetraphosphate (Ap4A) HIT family hydrolase